MQRMDIAPGMYPDLSNEDYHVDEAIGSTSIRSFLELPALYKHKQGNPHTPTPAMEFGTLCHTMMLEPEKLDEQYIFAPDTIKTRAVKAWKELYAQAVMERKKLIMNSDYLRACGMQSVLKSCQTATRLINGARIECSFFAKDEESGLMVKSRPDIWQPKHGHMIDYKTIGNIDYMSEKRYVSHAYGMGAQVQLAHHKNVLEKVTGEKVKFVAHIVQATVAPYPVRVFTFEDELWLKRGDALCREALDDINRCRRNEEWPAFNDEATPLDFPDWGGMELKEWSIL